MADLKTSLKEAPQTIMHRLSSEGTADIIEKLNKKLELIGQDRQIIPYLILRLAVKDLSPRQFITEISNFLSVDIQIAKAIADAIKEKILNPIKNDLFDWGVDINAIRPEIKTELKYRPEKHTVYEEVKKPVYVKAPVSSAQSATNEEKPFVIDLSERGENISPQQTPTEYENLTPFILRKEERPEPIAKKGEAKISVPVTLTSRKEKSPVSFRVELKENEALKRQPTSVKTAPPKDRVVHYVGPKTNLFPKAMPTETETKKPEAKKLAAQPPLESPPPEEVIDLSSFKKVQKPKSPHEPEINIEGNTVDLR